MFGWLKRASEPAAPPSPKLETVRHYVLTRKLGEGGMGVVFEARDERLGRLVAIKRVRAFSGDATLRDRLVREARTAAGISHPNICQVYELGEEGEELFVVMELLDGETLAARVGRGPVAVNEALQISLGILAALEAMHSRGIVHRDLKPSNVFLTQHGVKLLDFGLARPPALSVGDLEVTRSGTILGTPRYMFHLGPGDRRAHPGERVRPHPPSRSLGDQVLRGDDSRMLPGEAPGQPLGEAPHLLLKRASADPDVDVHPGRTAGLHQGAPSHARPAPRAR